MESEDLGFGSLRRGRGNPARTRILTGRDPHDVGSGPELLEIIPKTENRLEDVPATYSV